MRYEYFYQNSKNENLKGEIKAPSRAEAYALLRKRGIRPYRLIGDDPLPWRPVVFGILLFGVGVAFAVGWMWLRGSGDRGGVIERRQLGGDRTVVFEGIRDSWRKVFDSPLDRCLAAYAQPGTKVNPPLLTVDEIELFPEELRKPYQPKTDGIGEETRVLVGIVAGMRKDMRAKLAEGMSVADYIKFLDERQHSETEYRLLAEKSVEEAPQVYRYKVWKSVNARLNERGIETLEIPEGLIED